MLSQRQTLETIHKGECRLTGGFRPNGSSDPVFFYGKTVQAVSHDATGVWTITLKPEFRGYDITSRKVDLSLASAADAHVQMGAYDKSAGTLVVRVHTGGSLANIASAADNAIFFELDLRQVPVAEGVENYDS